MSKTKIQKNVWREVKLGDVAHINPTERLSKGSVARKISMDALQPFTKKISDSSFEKYEGGAKFRNGDTLIARITPCLENGKTCYVDVLEGSELAFGSTEFIVLREKKGCSEKSFLYYFSISPKFRDVAILAMTGSSGRQRVQVSAVASHLFLFPPLSEQKAIGEVLSSLDDKIDLLHRQNKTLESLAETLFRHHFIDNAGDDWEEGKLGDFFDVKTGKKNSNYGTDNGQYPFFTCSQKSILAPGYSFDGDAILLAGNADFNIKRYSGKFEAYQRTYVLMPYKEKYFSFLYVFMKYFLSDITGGHQGSVINFITKEMVENFPVKLPKNETPDLLERFEELNQIFHKVDSNTKQIQTLEKLRDTLLPKLISGETRVQYEEDV